MIVVHARRRVHLVTEDRLVRNVRPLKICGVARHPDGGAVQSARRWWPDRAG